MDVVIDKCLPTMTFICRPLVLGTTVSGMVKELSGHYHVLATIIRIVWRDPEQDPLVI